MGQQGYIALYRSIKKNFVWKDKPFTKGQAWVDILLEANHSDGGFFKRGVWVEVKRGQDGRSELTLADEWGWSRGKVRRFLSTLKKEEMIELKQDNKTTIITICNYDHFQPRKNKHDTPNSTADGTPNGHQTDTKRYTNNNDNNDKNDNKTTELLKKAFEKWWLTYPKRNGRRIGKKDAKKKFMKLKQDQWNDLKTATANYCDYLDTSGLSACDAKRFLNETWKEYIEVAEHGSKTEDDGTERAQRSAQRAQEYINS